MIDAEKPDYATLRWVKEGLNETIHQARQGLEAFAEAGYQGESLREFNARIHQVLGTLRMVQAYGAGMLAEEMEHTGQAILVGRVKPDERLMESLMLGLVQLPNYLTRLEMGEPDVPLVLLPIINDLRAARNAPPASNIASYAPNLDRLIESEPVIPGSGNPGLPEMISQLRNKYHKGLLLWYRDENSDLGLHEVLEVVQQINASAGTARTQRLMEAAEALVTVLIEGEFTASEEVKRLFSRVDRVFKQVIDEGEEATARDFPRELLKYLLYFISRSISHNPVVVGVKKSADLANSFPNEIPATADENREGADKHIIDAVKDVLLEDLVRVKEDLDLYIRGDHEDVHRLEGLNEILGRVGDTLGMVGRGSLRQKLQVCGEKLKVVMDNPIGLADDDLMAIATDLVAVESAIKVLTGKEVETDSTDEGELLAEAAVAQNTEVVIREAFSELSTIKEDVEAYVADDQGARSLSSALANLRKLTSVFEVAGLSAASGLMRDIEPYLVEIDNGQLELSGVQHDALIDVFAGLDYYLEARLDNRQNLGEILDFSHKALARLSQTEELVEEETEPETLAEQLDEILAIEDEPIDSSLTEVEIPDEMLEINLDLDIEEEPVADEEGEQVAEEIAEFAEEPSAVEPVAAETEPAEVLEEQPAAEIEAPKIQMDEIDPEIFEVFMEEANEELAVIQEQYPMWKEDTENTEPLMTFRRSFHTLKGSGRMVGALIIGEFAWAIENLLNRVLDGKVAAGPKLLSLLDDAVDALPQLVQGQAEGVAPEVDVAAMEQRAFALAEGEVVEEEVLPESELQPEPEVGEVPGEEELAEKAPVLLAEEEIAEETVAEETEEVSEPEVLEAPITLAEELYEIFLTESEMHIATVRAFIERCEVDACEITDELVRAIHTLRGSSHLAEVNFMADLAGEMEGYCSHLRKLTGNCDKDSLSLLERFIEIMDASLHAINVPGGVIPEWEGLLAGIRTAESKLPEVISELVETAAGDEGPTADPEMIGVFLEEAGDVVAQLETDFEAWEQDVGKPETADALKRGLHTLKGGARLTGLAKLGDLIHSMESLFSVMEETGHTADSSTVEVVRQALDQMENALDMLHLNQTLPKLDSVTGTLLEITDQLEQQPVEALSTPESELHEEDRELESILLSEDWEGETEIQDESIIQEPVSQEAAPGLPENVDPEMLEIFLEEAGDLIDQLEEAHANWSSDLTSKEAVDGLMRNLHTIKGNARFASLYSLGDLSHALESLFENIASGEIEADERMPVLVRGALDELEQSIENLQQGRGVQDLEKVTRALDSAGKGEAWEISDAESLMPERPTESILYKSTTQLTEETEFEPTEKDTSFIADSKLLTDSELFGESQFTLETNAELVADEKEGKVIPFPEREQIDFTRPEKRPPPMQPEEETGSKGERVRVLSELLDQLVNNAGEVSIYRARMEQQNKSVERNLLELTETVGRLQKQLRALELETEAQVISRHEREHGAQEYQDFDPLEMDRYSTMQQLSRALSETINDLSNIGETLGDLSRDTDTLLLQQARITNDLQDGLLRTRMVPFNRQAARLQRVVRQTSKNLGKSADLEVQGAEGEIDRTILNRMMGPLEHLLRNAVAHGIEAPEARTSAGKPEQGKVTLRLVREGSEIVLTIADDGIGLDTGKIREKAISRGMLAEDTEVSEDALYQFILEPGFTTATEVTQVAGRGVGMDAVVSEIRQLGGTLEIESQQGQGSSFVIRLPFTLAITEALLVKAADEVYAIPHGSVENIIRVPRGDLLSIYKGINSALEYGGHEYPVHYLGSMLGLAKPLLPSTTKWFPVLLVRAGEHRMAIQLDHLLGNSQIVVKSIGSQLSGVRWFTGGTILADGKIALLLDLNALVRSGTTPQVQEIRKAEEEEAAGVTVMVVDDSITVRKVTSRLLERHNMNVLTAKDGVDAVTVLQDHTPDIMLLDIEMPRMDGYELARHIRNTAELKKIPIIMITSRTGEKHRQRAMDLGVDRYLGKPYQEADLLDNIYTLLAERTNV